MHAPDMLRIRQAEEGALFDLRTRQREHAGLDLRPFTPPAMKPLPAWVDVRTPEERAEAARVDAYWERAREFR